MKIVILDGLCAKGSEYNYDFLKEYGDVFYYDRTSQSEVVSRCHDADIILLNKVVLDREILDKLKNVKLIQVLATGYNVVDIDYAREKGIIVLNIPKYSTMSVVQLTLGLLLEIANNIGGHSENVHKNGWSNSKDFSYTLSSQMELYGKTIGLIGYGEIAQNVARVLKSLGMNVLGYRRTKINDEYAKMCDLEEIYKKSDIISLHCPSTKDTIGMINNQSISKMKDGVIIINTARGNIVNENDIVNALNNGKILYYGADVLTDEPPKNDNKLMCHPHSIITPHIAWASTEARGRLFNILKDNIKGYFNGKIINQVNK